MQTALATERSRRGQRVGALLLAAVLGLGLALPALHALAVGHESAGAAGQHDHDCAQCQAFAHARSDLAPTAGFRLPTARAGSLLLTSDASAAGLTGLPPRVGSPRSPPSLHALS